MTRTTSKPTHLAAALIALPLLIAAGCDVDTHKTATGQPKQTGLTPGNGPDQSGSTATYKPNAGGPGAPGTTPENPAK